MSEGFKEYTIYKIECKDPEIKHLYVGSTKFYEKRVNVHKYECNDEENKGYDRYVYQKIREFGGFDNWIIEILEKVVCTKEDARKLEEEYRVKLKADLNSCKSYATYKDGYSYREYNDYLDKRREEKEKEEFYKIAEKVQKKVEKRNKYKEEYEKKAEERAECQRKQNEEHKEYLKEKKKVYKIREKERKMAELREKAKEYGDLSKFDKFPKP
jgi:hypothetical protein